MSLINKPGKNIYSYKGTEPELGKDVFIAPGVKIVGDVKLGDKANVWFNSVVRGDVNYISIGENTNIQDMCVLHVTGNDPLIIGKNVTVGHSAKLHGCIIEDSSLIGIGSIVLDGARIEKNAMVAAGSVVTPGKVIPSGKLAAGIPAKVLRDLREEELAYFDTSAKNYTEYAAIMTEELENGRY